jgi:light-regulated signal transduction histidine kinase (bacteriophytochrome)
LRAGVGNRQVEFTAHPGLTALGDEGLLKIALFNLIDNAWKFSKTRPVAHIEFGRTEADSRSVYFVRDNGVGFDMTHAHKLFGAFQRLHKASEFPGTGIGLAIVQRVVHRHGGRIWAEAEPGQGATFYFTLQEEI